MLLFDSMRREKSTPAMHQEARFAFLNRVATPFWGEVRRVLEEWFANVSPDDCVDLGTRFRSSDDRQHVGAFWELYLHELFTRLGFTVRLHPTLPDNTTTPDMLVEGVGGSFYVEAVALTNKEAEYRSSQKRAQVYDALNERVRSENFFLDVETVAEGSGTPPLALIGRTVNKWLASLDPNTVSLAGTRSWLEGLPMYEAPFADWTFRFRALPKRQDRRVSEGPTVGMFGPPRAFWVNDHKDLMDRISRKSRKYGDPDRPLVIALLYDRWTANAHHLTRALFGWGWGDLEIVRAGRLDRSWAAEADGIWLTRSGPANRDSFAILCAIHLSIWLHIQSPRPISTSGIIHGHDTP